jgi:hypothetical protein
VLDQSIQSPLPELGQLVQAPLPLEAPGALDQSSQAPRGVRLLPLAVAGPGVDDQ